MELICSISLFSMVCISFMTLVGDCGFGGGEDFWWVCGGGGRFVLMLVKCKSSSVGISWCVVWL